MLHHHRGQLITKIIKRKNKGGNVKMKELAERFIGKECAIYFFDGSTHKAVIKEVRDNAIFVEKGEKLEVVNLDFVMRIKG